VHLKYNKGKKKNSVFHIDLVLLVRSSRMEFNAGFGGPSLPKKAPGPNRTPHASFDIKGAKVEMGNDAPTKKRRLNASSPLNKKTE